MILKIDFLKTQTLLMDIIKQSNLICQKIICNLEKDSSAQFNNYYSRYDSKLFFFLFYVGGGNIMSHNIEKCTDFVRNMTKGSRVIKDLNVAQHNVIVEWYLETISPDRVHDNICTPFVQSTHFLWLCKYRCFLSDVAWQNVLANF